MLGLIVAAGIPALAKASGHDHGAPSAATKAAATQAAQPQSDGEIKKVDKEVGKITIKHGRLANLDMAPMTMVFKVKDPTMLEQVKVGDKVKFTAEKLSGALTVTALQSATIAGQSKVAETMPAVDTKAVAQLQSDGEIKKVDKEAGKITVKHGPLANLDMPAMTMVFKVKDAVMLEQVKTGDKVKFTAEKINGAFTITALQASM
ncbi:copper-binding protein [Massilia sp. TWR1-2-2]|uniref:copper-binding protein n=1 Tax=Massilia sp. TWR1-2-2 TaxID=2804584 RepID=UPI003CEEA32E